MRGRINNKEPTIPDSCFVAPNSSIIGDVALGGDCSVWPFASIRADSDTISIGARSNVQDCAVLHTAAGYPTVVGKGVTVGHQAVVHGCTVGDNVLVGMGARILSGAKIGEDCIIGAGAVVTEGAEIPEGSVVMGVPGKVVREMQGTDVVRVRDNARIYVEKKNQYRDGFHPVEP